MKYTYIVSEYTHTYISLYMHIDSCEIDSATVRAGVAVAITSTNTRSLTLTLFFFVVFSLYFALSLSFVLFLPFIRFVHTFVCSLAFRNFHQQTYEILSNSTHIQYACMCVPSSLRYFWVSLATPFAGGEISISNWHNLYAFAHKIDVRVVFYQTFKNTFWKFVLVIEFFMLFIYYFTSEIRHFKCRTF